MPQSTTNIAEAAAGLLCRAAAPPLNLYKQALKLARQQPCGDTSCDQLIAEKLQKAIDALNSQIAEGATGAVSLPALLC